MTCGCGRPPVEPVSSEELERLAREILADNVVTSAAIILMSDNSRTLCLDMMRAVFKPFHDDDYPCGTALIYAYFNTPRKHVEMQLSTGSKVVVEQFEDCGFISFDQIKDLVFYMEALSGDEQGQLPVN